MLCRTVKLRNGLTNQEVKGISTLRFFAVDDNFAASKENECFCLEDEQKYCPAGTLNLKHCEPAKTANIDIISTPPYFKNNLEILKDTGLVPPKELNQENYGTLLDIEPVSLIKKHVINLLMIIYSF